MLIISFICFCFFCVRCVLFLDVPAATEIYTYCHTLSLHDSLPFSCAGRGVRFVWGAAAAGRSESGVTLAAVAGFAASPSGASFSFGCVLKPEIGREHV